MTHKILIVDDDVETLRLVGILLEGQGYEIVAAQSGKQGMARVEEANPDLVILDISMPDMDGFEVCRQLRANPDMADLPIMMFTYKAGGEDRVEAFQAGADDFVTKPVQPAELISRVKALLVRSARRQVEEQPPMRAKILGFIGAKGGVGTTTLAVNVAVALAGGPAEDRRVILAELQPGAAVGGFYLGSRDSHKGLVRLLDQSAEHVGSKAVESQLEEHGSGVHLLRGQIEPPGIALPISPSRAEAVVRQLGATADYLLLDLGTGLSETNRHVLPECYHVVVTIEPQHVTLKLAQALLKEMMSSLGIGSHAISLVMVKKTTAAGIARADVEGFLKHEVAGLIISADELAFEATQNGVPIVTSHPNSLVAQQFQSVAEYLANV
jgi:CheY-like chemotaxis protein